MVTPLLAMIPPAPPELSMASLQAMLQAMNMPRLDLNAPPPPPAIPADHRGQQLDLRG